MISCRIGAAIVSLAIGVLILAGCPDVRFISDYDAETDRSLTEIQRKVDDFIETLIDNSGTAAASYESNLVFYDEIDTALRRLEFRVQSIPDNEKTVDLVENVRLVVLGSDTESSNESLRDLHRIERDPDFGPSPVALELARRNINQAISAALALELAKQRGME